MIKSDPAKDKKPVNFGRIASALAFAEISDIMMVVNAEYLNMRGRLKELNSNYN